MRLGILLSYTLDERLSDLFGLRFLFSLALQEDGVEPFGEKHYIM